MEISNLQSQLNKSESFHRSHQEQVKALEEKLDRAERAAGAAQREISDVRKNLDRASEKAVKEGSERSSAETKIWSLEREAEESKKRAEDSLKRVETLEKKLATLMTLHKESDGRRQVAEKEATDLRRKLAGLENENLRHREEKERLKRRDASGVDDEGVDDLEDEERKRLEDKVRALETEVFDLRRGVWRDKRRDMSGIESDNSPASPSSRFDDVDLTSGSSLSRRKSLVASSGQVLTNVLSSGFNAITGGGRHESQDLLDGMDDGFDEDAFQLAQQGESRKRIERAKELKRGLKDWEGWRMDIVDCRLAGGGAGEIFDV